MHTLPTHNPFVASALEFAHHWHAGRIRRFTGLRSIHHAREVAALTYGVLPHDIQAVAAALLHDVVDMSPVTHGAVVDRFGTRVGRLTREISGFRLPARLPPAEREAAYRDTIARASATGQTIKVLDIAANVREIAACDPRLAHKYLLASRELLMRLADGHPGARAQADAAIDEELERLGETVLA